MSTKAVLVDRSTLRLSEAARHVVIPEGIVDTLWFEVGARCVEFGDEFDVWQDGLGQVILGVREDGMFAATVGGVTLSIPRQVAKTFIVGRIVVALCTMYPNLTVLWTAHRTRTATNTFQKLKGFVMRKAVKPYLAHGSNNGTAIRDANGEQEIPFANGSRMLFGAREHGFGRGFDEVDIEVFDEAQILSVRALEDMVAATNQSRFERGALLFYMGTPPRPEDPGEAFASRRRDALVVKEGLPDFGEPVASGNALYVECSADSDVGTPHGPSLDDLRQVEKGNPSYPLRTPLVSIERLRKNLPSDDSWRREALGVWDEIDEVNKPVIPADLWAALAVEAGAAPRQDKPPNALAVDMSHDRVMAITGCWLTPTSAHVEILALDLAQDTLLAVEWIVERAGLRIPVVIDSYSPAASMIPVLKARKVKVITTNAADMSKACGGIYDDIFAGRLTHADQKALNDAVAGAKKRKIGDAGGWGWDRKDPSVNIAPLVSATLALFGAVVTNKPKSDTPSTRRGVIL